MNNGEFKYYEITEENAERIRALWRPCQETWREICERSEQPRFAAFMKAPLRIRIADEYVYVNIADGK